MKKFEKDVEAGIASYMKSRACLRDVAILDLLEVGIGRVAALDRHSSRRIKVVAPAKRKVAKSKKRR